MTSVYRDIVDRSMKPRSLAHQLALDEGVSKRGKPSLPKLKFMEGLGPEDPKFEPEFDWRHAVRCANVEVTEL